MRPRNCSAILILSLLAAPAVAAPVLASQCVACHTDAAKLKAIVKTLPQREVSAAIAGKG